VIASRPPQSAPPWPPRGRRRSRAIVLLALAALVNAGAGIALGIALTPDDPPAPPARPAPAPAPETIAAGDLTATLPQGWQPLSPPPTLAGFDGADAAGARGPNTELLLAMLPPEGPTLLPRALLEATGDVLPLPRVLEVDGRQTLHYQGLADGVADVYAVPTTAGVASIACVSGSSVALAHECDAAIEGVDIGRAAPVPADGRAAFAIGLPAVVARLNDARASGRRELARQSTPRGRARVARRLANAYRGAARRLAPLAGDEPSTTVIVRLLTTLRRDHRLLARASARRRPFYARRAGARIRAAEARLADELGKWTGPSTAK
jgi:hypothetical protein